MSSTATGFEASYAEALADHLRTPGEEGLERAYELGRRAVETSMSVLNVAAIHHHALVDALRDAETAAERERLGTAAAEFLVESLASFEMTQRGFEEARETARLERAHADSLRGLADMAVALSGARDPEALRELIAGRGRELLGAELAVLYLAEDGPVDHGVPELEGAPRLVAPLVARDGTQLGSLEMAGTTAEGFTPNDQAMMDQLANMVASTLENLRLYEREHAIAQTLQRSLLPTRLPEIPGIDLGARYLAAGEGNEVGGDFYDVFRVGYDRWLAVIGDVCGKGPEAAAITALARHTVRACAQWERDPAEIMRMLNRTLISHGTDGQFCTVTCAEITSDGARVNLDVAAAGHPLPLVLRADGEVEEVGEPGTLLGVFHDPDIGIGSVELGPGDTVLLYTDGLVEAQAPAEVWDASQLGGLLAATGVRSAGGTAERLEQAARSVQDAGLRDDIAIVVMRVGTTGDDPK